MLHSYVTQAELMISRRDLANILCRFFGITDDGSLEVVNFVDRADGPIIFQLVRHAPGEEA